MKKSNLLFYGVRKVDEGRVERFDVPSGEVFEKATEGYEMVSLSNGFEIFVVSVVSVTVESKSIFA